MLQNTPSLPGPGKPPIRERFAATKTNWHWYSRLFTSAMGVAAGWVKTPLLGTVLKKIVFMDDPQKHLTQSYTFNLNHPLNESDSLQNVVLPLDVIRKSIETSEYRSIMHQCLCRTGRECKAHDKNLGCIFIGRGAEATVRNGVAREATISEALAHLDKTVGQGLVGMGMWIEAENYIWGIKKELSHQWLEICFCCPCCCIALQNLKKVTPDVQQRFHHMGWQAVVTTKCNSCGQCLDVCPIGAIELNTSVATILDKCLGCGLCVRQCPEAAIEIKQIAPENQTIQDYFNGFRPEL